MENKVDKMSLSANISSIKMSSVGQPNAENQIQDDHSKLLVFISESCENFYSLGKDATRYSILKELHNTLEVRTKHPLDLAYSNSLDSPSEILISNLLDETEKYREISVKIIKLIYNHIFVVKASLSLLFTTLSRKLCKSDERESSEEVRMLEIDLLCTLVEKYQDELTTYLNDFGNILSFCIIDDCPEVKRLSCQCLITLSGKVHQKFNLIASRFLKPLLLTFSHQHLSTRALSVKAIGAISRHFHGDEFEQCSRHLAQRLFDRSPLVRTAVAEVLGSMLVSYPDRYSYFYRLIPMMLSTLCDDVKEVRLKGVELWEASGEQFLSENEDNYKDLVDFPKPDPDFYPKPGCRPKLGCRLLVQRNIYNTLPSLLNDLRDWTSETRLKSAQVLNLLIMHAEDKITIQLAMVIQGIVLCVKDDDRKCVEEGLNAAEWLGYFIDTNLLCDSVMMLIHSSPTAASLSVFSAVLQGNRTLLSDDCLCAVCKFLADSSICWQRKPDEQAYLVLCIQSLLRDDISISNESVSCDLFKILLSVSGLATNDSIIKKVNSLLGCLAKLQSISVDELFKKHSPDLIKALCENNELWVLHSPEMLIFSSMVQSVHNVSAEMLHVIIPVLINNLHQSKDPKIRSKMLSLLIPLFRNISIEKYEQDSKGILELIRSGIFPNLVWSAGKTAAALRTIASASLFDILNSNCFIKQMLKSIGEDLLPLLVTLTDDEESATRMVACKIFVIVLPEIHGCIDDIKIHASCHELLRTMDDECDDIRILSTKVLRAYIKSFPSDYNWNMYRVYLKHLVENAVIHVDDKDAEVRNHVLDLLKDVAYASPDILLQEIENKKHLVQSGDTCNALTEHIRSLKM